METKNVRRKRVFLKPYRLKDLTKIYGLSLYFMRKHLCKIKEAIGIRVGHYYNNQQIETIFKLLQLPSNIKIVSTGNNIQKQASVKQKEK